MADISQSGKQQNIRVRQGNDADFTFISDRYDAADPETKILIDLTGYQFTFKLAATTGRPRPVKLSFSDEGLVDPTNEGTSNLPPRESRVWIEDAANGQWRLVVTAHQNSLLKAGTYAYEIDVVLPDGRKETWFYGDYIVDAEVGQ